MLKYFEIVKTVFLEEIIYKNADFSDRFKIEIYKNADNLYSSRIFRSDLFDLKIKENGKITQTTEDIDVHYPFFSILENKKFSSIDECLNFTLLEIEKETKEIDTR